jgi:hypothetical protein
MLMLGWLGTFFVRCLIIVNEYVVVRKMFVPLPFRHLVKIMFKVLSFGQGTGKGRELWSNKYRNILTNTISFASSLIDL